MVGYLRLLQNAVPFTSFLINFRFHTGDRLLNVLQVFCYCSHISSSLDIKFANNIMILILKNNKQSGSYQGHVFIHIVQVVLFAHSRRFNFFQLFHFFINFTHLFLFGLFGSFKFLFVVTHRPLPTFHISCKYLQLK
jgi:hypothetical protein